MKNPIVDAPYKNSWADQQAANPYPKDKDIMKNPLFRDINIKLHERYERIIQKHNIKTEKYS